MLMATGTKTWTLEELHSLPDDGNKYELIYGELFVTPPPSDDHETIASRLTRILDPYVAANGLGFVYRPRAVVRFSGSEAEPDLMVRKRKTPGTKDWDDAPIPSLVVEIVSPSTRRRDREHKRRYYNDVGVPQYWIIDGERREVIVIERGGPDVVTTSQIVWMPDDAEFELVINVPELFDPPAS